LAESAGRWEPRRETGPKNTREPQPEPRAEPGAGSRRAAGRTLQRQRFQWGERGEK
jgi:hypothetical protein